MPGVKKELSFLIFVYLRGSTRWVLKKGLPVLQSEVLRKKQDEGLKLVLNMIDLTTLEGKDTEGKVKQLCYKAMHLHDAYPGLPTVAAVCVYPSMVKVAKKALGDSE